MLGCPITTYALACEHADAHAVIVPLCSLTKGALRRKYTLNLKMFFLLIRETTIISVAIDAPQDIISALSGRIGRLDGIGVKTVYSNK